ncbi:hypothetical protein [Streptomyces sp. NPDC057238]|uniref:hypothetical protein n=1 Tax=Streptomyces sp. NPDC057238 TaxID=3346060 RepID=UPI003627CCBB
MKVRSFSAAASALTLPLLFLSGATAHATSSTAAAPECHTVADTPIYQGGNIVYSGGVVCDGWFGGEVEVKLLMKEGTKPYGEVSSVSNGYCPNNSCYDTGYYPNRAGNQSWCTQVVVVNLRHATACESQNW